MADMEFHGIDLSMDGARSITLSGTLTEAGVDMVRALPPTERQLTVMLAEGQRWPDYAKRGRWVSVRLHGVPMSGRIRYRRLNRLVVDVKPA